MNHEKSKRRSRSGQALIEFALTLPLLLLLVINVINFGGFLYAWITVTNAARTAALSAVLSDSSIRGSSVFSATTIAQLAQDDLRSLRNRANVTVTVCKTANGISTCNIGGASGVADPENGSLFPSYTVDVSYPYQAFISNWRFLNLGVRLTLPSNMTVHRRVVMR